MSDPDDLPTTAFATEGATMPRLDTNALFADSDAKTIAVSAPAQVSLNLERTGDFIGRYRLITELGEGGFGVVWRAEQSEPIHREVALKVIKAGMDSREIIARFEAERQALALMDHPNIAGVLDAGTTDGGRPFFAMELVKGVPITDYCDAHQLTIRQRLELFIPVCQAVQHAHQKAILHRDLKPSNILVTEVDGKPVPKVIDFGIAKALNSTSEPALHATLVQTLAGMVIGTPQYMSPEQAGSMPDVDTRSDIYTLGVILYELLVGETPLSREQMKKAALDEMLRLVRENEPRRPSSKYTPATELTTQTASLRDSEPKKLGHALRGDLDWIVLKALEKDRTRRYDTSNAFALDLRRHLDDEPVSAGPPSASYRIKKLIRRNKAAVALASLALLSIFGFLILVSINSAQVRRERNHALQQEQEANRQRDRSDQLFTKSLLTRAEELLTAKDTAGGIAHLSFALRRHPEDCTTAARLLSALRDRSHARILQGGLHHGSPAYLHGWTDDGRQLLTALYAGRTSHSFLWNVESGAHEKHPIPGFVYSVSHDMSKLVVSLAKKPAGTLQVFDAKTGQPASPEMQQVTSGDGASQYGVDGLLSHDNRWLLSRGGTRTVAVWDVAKGTKVWSYDGGAYASSCQYSQYGDIIAAGYPDGTVVVAALTDGQWKTRCVKKIEDSTVMNLDIHRSGQLIAANCEGKKFAIVFLKLDTEKPETQVLERDRAIESFAFSPNGKTIALTQLDKPAELWELAVFRLAHQFPAGDYVSRIVHSDDGGTLATITKNGVQIWNAWTGSEVTRTPRMLTTVTGAKFSPDASQIAVSTADGRALVFSTQPTKAVPLLIPNAYWNLAEAFTGAILHEDGIHYATRTWISEKKGSVSIYDIRTGKLSAPPIQTNYGVRSLVFQPHSDQIWLAGANRAAEAWDWKQGKMNAKLGTFSRWVSYVDFDRSGRRVLLTGSPLLGQLWDVQTKKQIGEEWPEFRRLRLSPDGQSMAMQSEDNASISIYAAETHAQTGPQMDHGSQISLLELADDWSTAVTVNYTGEMKWWNVKTGALIASGMGHENNVTTAAFSKNGQWLATASHDNTARIWSARDGRPQGAPLRHSTFVESAQFSPQSDRVGTVCYDRTARVWDVATSRPLTEPLELLDRASSCLWRSEGQHLISVGRILSSSWDVPAVTSATPAWLADWAETVGGARLDENGDLEAVDITRQAEFQKLSATVVGDDVFAKTLRWFYAPLQERPLSPCGTMTRENIIEVLAAESNASISSLATSMAPEKAGSWALGAWNLVYAAQQNSGDAPEVAEWLIEVAAKRDANDPMLWLAKAALHARRKQMDDAEQCCIKGLAAAPSDLIRDKLQEYLARVYLDHAKASEARDILVRLVGTVTPAHRRDPVLHERARLLKLAYLQLDSETEAGQLNCALLDISPRQKNTAAAMLDLSADYNSRLDESETETRHSFVEMPSGVHPFAGVTFDVRGIVRLSSVGTPKPIAQAQGIPVGRKCARMHFLHATESTFKQKDIGTYVIHYEDGQDVSIPLVSGKNIADRYYYPPKGGKPYPTPLSPLVIGWQGENPSTRSSGMTHLWVFLHTWENPRAEVAVKSVDAISNGTAPLCIFGITTE